MTYLILFDTCSDCCPAQVLFDDIGPSLIQLSSPDLQLRLLLRFLAFLGLPVDSVLCADPCQPGLLLERLSFLTQGKKKTKQRRPQAEIQKNETIDDELKEGFKDKS